MTIMNLVKLVVVFVFVVVLSFLLPIHDSDEALDEELKEVAVTEPALLPHHDLRGPFKRPDATAAHTVVELFMYTCPHCYRAADTVHEWDEAHPTVSLETVPIVFHERDVDYIRLHYGLIELGVDKGVVEAGIFDAVHFDGNYPKTREDFVALGVAISDLAADDINSAMDHPAVDKRVQASRQLFASSGSNSVPTFVVNSQFRIDMADARKMADLTDSLSDAVK